MSTAISKGLRLSDYEYHLPKERIAQYPPSRREESRLLVLDRSTGRIEHCRFRDLDSFLSPRDLLVVNETKVIPARLLGVKVGTGARLEVFVLRDLGGGRCEALLKPQRRVQAGVRIEIGGDIRLRVGRWLREGVFLVQVESGVSLGAVLDRLGQVPLPPYVRRDPVPEDRDRYQTVFASAPGAVAAPTAGLHFTAEHLEALTRKGVGLTKVVLHTGLGSFRPIKRKDVSKHRMEAECFEVGEDAVREITRCRVVGGRVVVVGTTTTRALESAARWNGSETLRGARGETEQFIYPPFAFRVVDCLVTNFHQPRSSLLLLVAAFAGRDLILKAYGEALEREYRFLSYGDCMLII